MPQGALRPLVRLTLLVAAFAAALVSVVRVYVAAVATLTVLDRLVVVVGAPLLLLLLLLLVRVDLVLVEVVRLSLHRVTLMTRLLTRPRTFGSISLHATQPHLTR